MDASRLMKGYVVGLLVLMTSTIYGQELDTLKVRFDAEIAALNGLKLEATLAEVHDNIVLFGVFSPFPIEGKAAFREAVTAYFEDHAHATLKVVTPQFRLIGPSGLAWGYYDLSAQLNSGQPTRAYGRYMFTYTLVEGNWRILSMHFSTLVPTLR